MILSKNGENDGSRASRDVVQISGSERPQHDRDDRWNDGRDEISYSQEGLGINCQ